jgi:hypothetical protein
MMTNPAFLLFSTAYAVSFPLLLIALIAVYRRHDRRSRIAGRAEAPPYGSPAAVTPSG